MCTKTSSLILYFSVSTFRVRKDKDDKNFPRKRKQQNNDHYQSRNPLLIYGTSTSENFATLSKIEKYDLLILICFSLPI